MAMAPATEKPVYGHGILGYWAIVGHGFNIASIVSSCFVIAAVIVSCYRKPEFRNRTSFRLSAWIAACDLIYSALGICTFNNGYMSDLSEMHLRVIHWLMSASTMCFVFLTVAMGIQLILTVLTHKSNVARRIEKYYEYVCTFMALVLTHPILYLYERVEWVPTAQIFHIKTYRKIYNRNVWLTKWMWIVTSIVFLLIVTLLIWNKMIRSFTKTAKLSNFPEGKSRWDDEMTLSSVNAQRKREIRSVTLRIVCYPLVPIFTQSWVFAANMITNLPMWLYVVGSLLPALQGVLNFLIFLMNPAWDGYRSKLFKRILPPSASSSSTSATGFKEIEESKANQFASDGGSLDYSKRNASTVHLSPYQSREAV
ncbi:hypothetical protein GGI12_002133 [Dipsacomyces acuminosporus]|nr:hypothetical protein GGI12_002133 [Dipsacomyces acuminosporus]